MNFCTVSVRAAPRRRPGASATEALGHEVGYIDMPDEDWQQQASAVGYDPHAVAHLTKLWELFRLIGSGHPLYHVTETIEQIGGAPPRSLRNYLDALYQGSTPSNAVPS